MTHANTINVCLGHIAFPRAYSDHVDVMIAPRLVVGPARLVIVDDALFGAHGGALSEYVQLLWLYRNFDAIVADCAYVRIIQYRRFVARKTIGRPSTNPWEPRWIRANEIGRYGKNFSRRSNGELFNRPVRFDGGMRGQYAMAHVIDDLLNFAEYLKEEHILDEAGAAAFLAQPVLISACNTGVFHRDTLREILSVLERAADFLRSRYFVPREGYQRRLLGFLLERLNSHLILTRIERGASAAHFGCHVLISDSPVVSTTK